MKWICLKNRWPEKPGSYCVQDIRKQLFWQSKFDGWNFDKVEYDGEVSPPKGSLLLVVKEMPHITHWRDDEMDIYQLC